MRHSTTYSKYSVCCLSLITATSCAELSSDGNDSSYLPTSSPNILFILADDLGVDAMGAYPYTGSKTVIKANTPNIDKLQANGIVFNEAWSSPLSTPTRAAAITGMYGYNSGMTTLGNGLSEDIPIIHASMPDVYSTALIGKWHLAKQSVDPEATYGIDHFVGADTGGSIDDYYSWPLTQNLVQETCTEYVTTKLTDLTIAWIAEQDGPWMCWLTHIAPHTPLHVPPANLHTRTDLAGNEALMAEGKSLPHFLAAVESMDTEIGRLLDSIDEQTLANTIIIFMGDNGTALGVVQAPYNQGTAKGSLYEGGVRVPLIVSGDIVDKSVERSYSLISAPDIFATTLELAGVSTKQYKDSYSFAGEILGGSSTLRKYSFADVDRGSNPYSNAIRNLDYKLVTVGGEPSLLTKIVDYADTDVISIADDTVFTPEQQAAYDELWAELQRMNIQID